MDLLKKAAKAWRDLYSVKYNITYGRKRKLYDIDISFRKSDFFHLAGFQYLKDIRFPNIPPNLYIEYILRNEIKGELIKKGEHYEEMVKSRLLAIINLQEALDNDLNLYTYNRLNYAFHTFIEANNFILSNSKNDDIFIFLVKNENRYVCSSIFMKRDRDYSENQTPLSILRIMKTNLKTHEQHILIDKLREQ